MRFEVLFFLGSWVVGLWLAPHLLAWLWSNGSLTLIIGCWLFGGIILGAAIPGKRFSSNFALKRTQALPDAIFSP